MLNQPVRLCVGVVSLLLSTITSCAGVIWASSHTLSSFKASRFLYSIDQSISDAFHSSYASGPVVEEFDKIVDKYDPYVLVEFMRTIWTYQVDKFTDVSLLPQLSFAEAKGDCDDFARLAAYIYNRRGYKTYYVGMFGRVTGHAVAVWVDVERQKLVMSGVDASFERTYNSGEDIFTAIGQLAQQAYGYGTFQFISIQSPDIRKTLTWLTIEENGQ